MARPRQFTNEEILRAAREVFLEHGPATSTQRVAQAVGVSQAVIFKRFRTKENLMIAALAPPAEPGWLGLVVSGPDPRPIPEQLCEIGSAALNFFHGVVPGLMTLKAAGIDPEALMRSYEEPPPLRVQRELGAWFDRARADARLACADPRSLALHFMGALHVRAFIAHLLAGTKDSRADDEAYVRHLVDTLWQGVAPVEGAA